MKRVACQFSSLQRVSSDVLVPNTLPPVWISLWKSWGLQTKKRNVSMALPIISHLTALAASAGKRVGINWPTWLRHIEVKRVVPADFGSSRRGVWWVEGSPNTFVALHIYLHIYRLTYIYTYIHIYIYTCIFIYILNYTYIYIYTHLHIYILTYIYIHLHIYIYLHIYVHLLTYILYICIYMYKHTYIYIHICIVYTCTFFW